MGGKRWDPAAWSNYSASNIQNKRSVSGAAGIYSATSMKNDLDPKGVTRESRDSVDNPLSTPVIVALDVTGSMDNVLNAMARVGLETLATEIHIRKPVTDPHIMFMGVGDAFFDNAPLQVTQFEADIRIAEQLTNIYLEKGGGGNGSEGYVLPWYFASRHTEIDCMLKRKKKGFLFTLGDDGPTPMITVAQAKQLFGDTIEADISAEELLKMVSRSYEVFHLIIEEGYNFTHTDKGDDIKRQWRNLLGERAILLSDHTKMGEVIISLLQVLAGADKADIVNSWDGSTGLVVSRALTDIASTDASNGLVKF